MGLLSRMGRRAANFASGAATRMADRASPNNWTDNAFRPVSSALAGGLGGGFIGAAANPDDPGVGALAGAGIGALGGAGLSAARQLGAGAAGGLRHMGAMGTHSPEAIANEVKTLARQNRQEAERYLDAIARENPTLAEEVMVYLR